MAPSSCGSGDGQDAGGQVIDGSQSDAVSGSDSGGVAVDSGAIDGSPSPTDGGEETAYFCVSDAVDDHFVLRLDDPDKISTARDMVKGLSTFQHVGGNTAGPETWNPYWSFHIVPSSVYFFEASIEICDAAICWVHQNGPPTGNWCPWTSTIEYEITDQDFAGCVGTPSC